MINLRHIILALIVVGAFTACSAEKKSEKFSYNYTVNGCSTGERSFDSQDSYCAGLKDENQDCAAATETLRRNDYEAKCGGTF